ncbi:MAG: cobalamin biosynthesis protein CobW [Pseudomonadota bacterium]
MQSKIPCTVITGFLGAGKTTLVQSMLSNSDGRRLALIINEFGTRGVDGDLVRACGLEDCEDDDVVELANGCICCTVADDFVPTLTKLLDRPDPPDHIVIETSGLALPQPLLRAFAWPEVKPRVTVDGVVTVVDAQAVADGRFADDEAAIDRQRAADDSLDHDSPLSDLFADQLSCADLIVMSKTDLVDEVALARVGATVDAGKRAAAKTVHSGARKPPISILLGVDAQAENDAAHRKSRHESGHHHDHDHEHAHGDHHHDHDHDHGHDHDDHHHHDHDHDAFESFVIEARTFPTPEAVSAAIAKAGSLDGVLRIKGFVPIDGKPMRLVVQAVGPRVTTHFDRPWRDNDNRNGELVVIGLAGLDKAAITAAIRGADA